MEKCGEIGEADVYMVRRIDQAPARTNTAGNGLFKSTKNDKENKLNMCTCFRPFFELLNPLKIIYFNSDKM